MSVRLCVCVSVRACACVSGLWHDVRSRQGISQGALMLHNDSWWRIASFDQHPFLSAPSLNDFEIDWRILFICSLSRHHFTFLCACVCVRDIQYMCIYVHKCIHTHTYVHTVHTRARRHDHIFISRCFFFLIISVSQYWMVLVFHARVSIHSIMKIITVVDWL